MIIGADSDVSRASLIEKHARELQNLDHMLGLRAHIGDDLMRDALLTIHTGETLLYPSRFDMRVKGYIKSLSHAKEIFTRLEPANCFVIRRENGKRSMHPVAWDDVDNFRGTEDEHTAPEWDFSAPWTLLLKGGSNTCILRYYSRFYVDPPHPAGNYLDVFVELELTFKGPLQWYRQEIKKGMKAAEWVLKNDLPELKGAPLLYKIGQHPPQDVCVYFRDPHVSFDEAMGLEVANA